MATNEGQEEVDCVEETTTFTSVIDFVFLGDAGKSSGHVHIELMVLFICALTITLYNTHVIHPVN